MLIAFAFGFSLVAMAYSIGNVSGCHINPAVSVGMFISGRMSGKDFLGYVVAPVLGAALAAIVWDLLYKEPKTVTEEIEDILVDVIDGSIGNSDEVEVEIEEELE